MKRFFLNLGWMSISELIVRVSRVLSVLIIARYLTPEDYGIAALVIATYEISRLCTQTGIGTQIINTSQENLSKTCAQVYLINWGTHLFLCGFVVSLAWPFALFYDRAELTWMIVYIATIFLIYPFSMVHVYLLQRSNELKHLAIIQGVTISLDNIACAALAYSGYGAWSVVIPKPIVAIIWVISFRHYSLYHFNYKLIDLDGIKQTFRFAYLVLPTEIFKGLRQHGDVYIVGKAFGEEILGLYSFAKNAGLGITASIIQSYTSALLPALTRQGDKTFSQHYLNLLKPLAIIGVIILSQSLLAPLYVPLIFGEQWNNAIIYLQIICLYGVPIALLNANTQMLRINNEPLADLKINAKFTLLFFTVFSISVFNGLYETCIAILVLYYLYSPYLAFSGFQLIQARKSPENLNTKTA